MYKSEMTDKGNAEEIKSIKGDLNEKEI